MFPRWIAYTSLIGLLYSSSAQAQYHTAKGAGLGGAAGAIIGGVIGHQNDETAEGALIGGAVGAVAGGVMGRGRDNAEADAYRYQQWQYYNSQQQYQQQYQRAASLSDVIVMSRNGLSDAVIMNHIQLHGVQQRLTVQDVISLHQQGVSEPVISCMQSARVAGGYAVASPVVVERQYHVVPAYPAPPPYYRAYHYHGGYGYRYR